MLVHLVSGFEVDRMELSKKHHGGELVLEDRIYLQKVEGKDRGCMVMLRGRRSLRLALIGYMNRTLACSDRFPE